MRETLATSWPGINKGNVLKAVNSLLPPNKAVKEFGLVFVSAGKMRELNKKYRHRSGATNVLSFETGDVVICPEVIKKEAREYGFTQKNWMTRLIVHGILHLAGYDHKHTRERRVMERLEAMIVGKSERKTIPKSQARNPNF